jgi:hypothetical protein
VVGPEMPILNGESVSNHPVTTVSNLERTYVDWVWTVLGVVR